MKSKTLSLLVSLLGANVILGGVFVYGLYNIQEMNEETSLMLGVLDDASNQEILVRSAEVMREASIIELRKLDTLKLKEDQVVGIIEQIEEVGRQLNLEAGISSVNAEDDPATGGARKIRMIVEAKGDWARTAAFLRAVENLPYRVNVESAHLNKDDEQWTLRTTLVMQSFN